MPQNQHNIMRLQKFMSRSGVDSRRACEKLILDGRVSVNGVCVTQLGTNVDADKDLVCFDGRPLRINSKKVVLMLNKPLGYVSTMKVFFQ